MTGDSYQGSGDQTRLAVLTESTPTTGRTVALSGHCLGPRTVRVSLENTLVPSP